MGRSGRPRGERGTPAAGRLSASKKEEERGRKKGRKNESRRRKREEGGGKEVKKGKERQTKERKREECWNKSWLKNRSKEEERWTNRRGLETEGGEDGQMGKPGPPADAGVGSWETVRGRGERT